MISVENLQDRNETVTIMRNILLLRRTWSYLRYWHMRDAMRCMVDCETFCIVGAGYGLAEIAIAAEFPERKLHLTDHSLATHSFSMARSLVKVHSLSNVTFGELDLLSNCEVGLFDAVCSVEVLEHIHEYELAANNMKKMSRKKLFCMVPFATKAQNADERLRKRAWELAQHVVCGFDDEDLRNLFPGHHHIRGTYWNDAGLVLRQFLMAATDEEILQDRLRCFELADADIRPDLPLKNVQGIYTVVDI